MDGDNVRAINEIADEIDAFHAGGRPLKAFLDTTRRLHGRVRVEDLSRTVYAFKEGKAKGGDVLRAAKRAMITIGVGRLVHGDEVFAMSQIARPMGARKNVR